MSYIVPIHRPNSIRHATKVRLLSKGDECLAVAKVNRLEIFEQAPTGLVLKYATTIYGFIIALQKLKTKDEQAPEHLLVVTDRHHYFTVSWDSATSRLKSGEAHFTDPSGNGNESMNVNTCLIDPTSHLMVLNFFDGIMLLVSLNVGKRVKQLLGSHGLHRVKELLVRSSGLLSGLKQTTLALLWEDAHGAVFVTTKNAEFTPGHSTEIPDLKDAAWSKTGIDRSARFLIPVPDTNGGMLIVSEVSIQYLDPSGTDVTTELDDPTIFCAWDTIDGPRHLLGDDYGRLYLLFLDFSKGSKPEIKLTELGKIPRAAVLIHLDNGLVFVGSHQGDSQVIKLRQDDQPIEVLQTLQNISPVLDFSIMDMGNPTGDGQANEFSSGQARIVTGSGSFESGSLRSVRSGVALHDAGLLAEIYGTQNLFSLSSLGMPGHADLLLVSSIEGTRAFKFSPDGEAEEVEDFKGLASATETLAAANCPGGRYIQVTGSEVRLVDFDSGTIVSQWAPPLGAGISAASTNDDYILVSVAGSALYLLDISKDLAAATQREFNNQSLVSCIALPAAPSKVCAVGFWSTNSIALLSLSSFEEVCTDGLSSENTAVPRTLIIAPLIEAQPPTLLVGMADGLVYSFSADLDKAELGNRRAMILGTEEANFKTLPRTSTLKSVFATCEHPSLIYGSENRIVCSAVTVDKVTAVCEFNSEAFPGCIVVATGDEIRIMTVDTERTTHVRTLPLATTVRRIAYSVHEKLFALGTIDRELVDDVETNQSRIKLVDEIMFEDLATFNLNRNELVECVIRGQLPGNNAFGDGTFNEDEKKWTREEYFLVGTSYLDSDSAEATRGRIIVFEVTQDRRLERVAELGLKGACRCLGILDGRYIVAALSRTIAVFVLITSHTAAPALHRLATYRTSSTPISLSISSPSIVVADIMKSITVLTFTPSPDTPKLTEIARHFSVLWSTAVLALSPTSYLLADAAGNILTLRQNASGLTADDNRRLEVTAEMHLGEQINALYPLPGEVVPTVADPPVVPVAFAATAQGGVYLIGSIEGKWRDVLMKLQLRLAARTSSSAAADKGKGKGKAVEGLPTPPPPTSSDIGPNDVNPQGLEFLAWRGFKNSQRREAEPFRFVDGEMVERFAELGEHEQRSVASDVGQDVEEVRALVEGLRRLH